MKVNTIIGILLISANLYAKSAVAVEEQLNHNLRRLAKPSCGDGKVSGKEDCEPPNTATCDANCKSIVGVGPTCDGVRCSSACVQKDDGGPEVNCNVGTTCNLCDDPNEVGCTRNDCTLPDDGTVCVEQSFKCVPDEITTAATEPMTTTATESAVTVECTAVRCPNPCLKDPCISLQKACNTCIDGDVGCTGTCPVEDVFCWGYKCEGCIEDGDACSGNCSGCCSKKSTNLGGGLGKKCVAK